MHAFGIDPSLHRQIYGKSRPQRKAENNQLKEIFHEDD